MRCCVPSLVVFLVALLGCTPYPRFRTGGAERPPEYVQNQSKYTTDDHIKLGLILQKFLGKPYRGASRYVQGVDCSLFAREVFKQFDDIVLPRTVKEQYRTGREIPRTHLTYGDLVFFRTVGSKVSHVGIYIGYNQFIHASTSRGVIITGMNEKYWAERYVGAHRILE